MVLLQVLLDPELWGPEDTNEFVPERYLVFYTNWSSFTLIPFVILMHMVTERKLLNRSMS